ncbi:serine/threonine-protein kinase [Nostoc sp. 'Lobaria pulmonaria (5183) cyanobiont']|uniref:serine/threonine-protein kinase n=1 Tax=Nostoc sp. 'Lobaria pulmonaria (5183) cyanobiont' TaxID=1618022 RepID=UPI000CF337BA|nr:serine/threonine-protein kinase [Nostoc sp. 'Lobaria pulmonaria (5183) cyanobiont']AVH74151.1 serine/threonine protein kinase [Nostoc sp. 'Lobaria pulmonaria (5183) cyanobiont']
MTKIYCSKGHENSPGSRFCLQCGENLLDMPMSYSIQPGLTLGDRYVIVRQIGQGGFGRTYLAEDVNRFRELCVLKEFSPQVQTAYVVEKAEELFEREASVLYKLQHPQIPRFRELLRLNLGGKEYLFLVQDYVEGETYNSLLNARIQQGLRFTETEIRQLFLSILPVLEYIHSLGVIHRDISPDNLMLRTVDKLPVLIDFGGVKQVVATVASEYYQPGMVAPPPAPTLLGKIGFAPPEQMQTGLVSPHSDLYAMAATMLVLLTGKQPQELIDTYTLTWQWRREVSLSQNLAQVLDKMLSARPSDRYQSARQVLQALNPPSANYPPTQYPTPPQPTSATVAVSPPPPPSPSPSYSSSPPPSSWWTPTKTFLVAALVGGSVGLIWWGLNGRRDVEQVQPNPTVSPTPTSEQPTDPLAQYSPAERERKEKLSDRRQQLGIDSNFYVNLVNQVFWDRNPSLRGRTLSNGAEDESLRAEWDKTASELLEKLAPLSNNARQKMGTYTTAERDRWKVEVNKVNVGSRSLYDLGDAAFSRVFPEQRSKNFQGQPIGQVWYGFVSDRLSAILGGSAFQKLVFDPGATGKTVNGTLQPGDGKVFIAGLAKEQSLDLKLEANSQVLLSVYSPSGKIRFLEDSTKRSLSTKLAENGFYEFVVVSTATKPVDYQLTITAENPTPLPFPTATPTETSTPTPAPTPTPTPTPIPTPTKISTPEPEPTPIPTPETTP